MSGEHFSYLGQHFAIDGVALLPTRVQQPRIPILVAGFWLNTKHFQRGARWDGIMPTVFAGGDYPPADEVTRAMLEYHHSITDEIGDIFIPLDVPSDAPACRDVCKRYGVT